MARVDDDALANALTRHVRPLLGRLDDFDRLLDLVGAARVVLMGEASHGTHDFYRMRAALTKRLITEMGFSAVAAEADWPDAYRVNRYVRGMGTDAGALESLADFRRFPAWMWRNADVLDFVGWLRAHNDRVREPGRKVGFYGLDLYSLHTSMEAVLDHLDRTDPEAARRARYRYACFDQFEEDPQAYGYAASFGLTRDCERQVVAQLVEMQSRRHDGLVKDGFAAEDEAFQAEQNARVVRDAEEYYRAMFGSRASSWNLRDTHMADTLDALLAHLEKHSATAKVVVWAHNSHVGDARATQMGEAGELSIGQLARQRHPGEARLIGFSTNGGTVTAASDWGAPAERMTVRPGLPGSYERVFHLTGVPKFLLMLRGLGDALGATLEPRLQRAIGVIYRPPTERVSHCLHTLLPDQFDAMIHLDQTRAVEPLERTAGWERGEVPETYPTGV